MSKFKSIFTKKKSDHSQAAEHQASPDKSSEKKADKKKSSKKNKLDLITNHIEDDPSEHKRKIKSLQEEKLKELEKFFTDSAKEFFSDSVKDKKVSVDIMKFNTRNLLDSVSYNRNEARQAVIETKQAVIDKILLSYVAPPHKSEEMKNNIINLLDAYDTMAENASYGEVIDKNGEVVFAPLDITKRRAKFIHQEKIQNIPLIYKLCDMLLWVDGYIGPGIDALNADNIDIQREMLAYNFPIYQPNNTPDYLAIEALPLVIKYINMAKKEIADKKGEKYEDLHFDKKETEEWKEILKNREDKIIQERIEHFTTKPTSSSEKSSNLLEQLQSNRITRAKSHPTKPSFHSEEKTFTNKESVDSEQLKTEEQKSPEKFTEKLESELTRSKREHPFKRSTSSPFLGKASSSREKMSATHHVRTPIPERKEQNDSGHQR
jgi:hypothetical protein